MDYVKFEKINLKTHPEFTEKWVQERIAADPQILGLGDIILKDKERIQPRAGRLDLLFQESDGNRRFEVELQLGALLMKAISFELSSVGTSNENDIRNTTIQQ